MYRFLLGLAIVGLVTAVQAEDRKDSSAEATQTRRPAAKQALYIRITDQADQADQVRPLVYESEEEFQSSAYHAKSQLQGYTSLYGYPPGCCEDREFSANLWAGYCETRKTRWYSRWLFGPFRSKSCDNCDSNSCSCK